MPILAIEHAISDFDTWSAAFGRLQAARDRAGVRAHRVRRPVDDPNYVLIELDFDTLPQAQRFLGFLESDVWSTPGKSPALTGTPQTKFLELTHVYRASRSGAGQRR